MRNTQFKDTFTYTLPAKSFILFEFDEFSIREKSKSFYFFVTTVMPGNSSQILKKVMTQQLMSKRLFSLENKFSDWSIASPRCPGIRNKSVENWAQVLYLCRAELLGWDEKSHFSWAVDSVASGEAGAETIGGIFPEVNKIFLSSLPFQPLSRKPHLWE